MSTTARSTVLEALLALAFTLYVAWPLLDLNQLVVAFDSIAYSGPNFALSAEEWRHLRIPEWNQMIFGGVPHLANPQAGVFYPLKLPFLFVDAERAINLLTAAHFALLAVGIVVLVRWRLHLQAPAGCVAAVAIVGSGMSMARGVQFEQMVAIAWAPWLLIATDWIIHERPLRWSIPTAAVLVAVMVSGAHPQPVYSLLLLLLAWTFGRVAAQGAWRRLWFVSGAGAFGAMLAAAQLLPSASFATRAADIGGRTLDFVGNRELVVDPNRLPGTLFGDVFSENQAFLSGSHENMTSVGVAVLMLALVGLIAHMARRSDKWTVVALSSVAFGSLVLACGPSTPLYRLLFHTIPGFDLARAPARWRDLTVLGLAILAAFGTHALRVSGISRRQVGAVAGCCSAGAATVALGPFDLPGARATVTWAIIVVLMLGAAVLSLSRRLAFGAATFAAVIVAAELGMMAGDNFFRQLSVPASVAARPGPAASFLQKAGGRIFALTAERLGEPQYILDSLRPNANVELGIRTIDGYDGGVQVTRTWADAVTALAGGDFQSSLLLKHQAQLPLDPELYARFGVQWVMLDETIANQRLAVPKWRGPVVTDGAITVWENPAFLGEARIHYSTHQLGDDGAADMLRQLATRGSGAALVDDTPTLACAEQCRSSAAAVRRTKPGVLDVKATTDRHSLLVVTEQWDPGWSAYVDGERSRVIRSDGMFLGVELSPGRHSVRFRYRTPGLQLGLTLSALAWIALIALVFGRPGWEWARTRQSRNG